MDSGKFKFTMVDFDLRVLFRDIIIMMSMQAKIKGVKLDMRVDHDIPTLVRSDPNRIRQVILNFLSNSLKFTLEGSIELSASNVSSDDNLIEITVSDTGIGISDEN